MTGPKKEADRLLARWLEGIPGHGKPTLRQMFVIWALAHPQILATWAALAKEMALVTPVYLQARLVTESLRNGTKLKISDKWTPYLAWWAATAYTELADCFRFRNTPSADLPFVEENREPLMTLDQVESPPTLAEELAAKGLQLP